MADNRHTAEYVDYFICCGAPVPEGRMICSNCEYGDNISQNKEVRYHKNKLFKIFSKFSFRRNEERN